MVIPILAFVLYLGGTAIMKGFNAKNENKLDENVENNSDHQNNYSNETEKLSEEVNKLNELFKSGVLTQDEFEKAKKKILN